MTPHQKKGALIAGVIVFIGGAMLTLNLRQGPHATPSADPFTHSHIHYAYPLLPLDHPIPLPPEGFPQAPRKVLGFRILKSVPGYPLPNNPRIAAVTVEWYIPKQQLKPNFILGVEYTIGGDLSGPAHDTWLQTSSGPVYPTSALMDASVNPMVRQDEKLANNDVSGVGDIGGSQAELFYLPKNSPSYVPGTNVTTLTGTLYYALPTPTTKVYGIVWTNDDWPTYEVANPAYHS